MKIHDGDHSPHLSASQMRQKGKKKTLTYQGGASTIEKHRQTMKKIIRN